jgi:hypothetical protein
MKNFITLLIVGLAFTATSFAQSPRFGTTSRQDNTGRVLTYGYAAISYDDTVTVVPNAYETIYKYTTLTGNSLVYATETNAKIGDKVYFLFNLGSGGARTVTFGTGFIASATLVVDSAQAATITFMYNGSDYIEIGRAKE